MSSIMMWYVSLNGKNSKIKKSHIEEALKYFENKYKKKAYVVFVHPEQDIQDTEIATILRDKCVLKSHMYVAETERALEPEEKKVTYRDIEEYN